MTPIHIYSAAKSARLTYVLNWLFTDRLQVPYVLVHSIGEIPAGTFFIAYGEHIVNALSIPDAGLLSETGIKQHDIPAGSWYGIPTLYCNDKAMTEGYSLPFDLFSALFFLLSRYEEYYPYKPDKHGRYPATESVLFKRHWLRRPLVDEWVHQLRLMLGSYSGLKLTAPAFRYIPTYDIDIAYSYLGKGIRRNLGGLARDVLSARTTQALERTMVVLRGRRDPYDSYGYLARLHKKTHTAPLYFILCAQKSSAFDKNIPPTHPAMQRLIKHLQHDGAVYIHPSYNAQGGDMMVKEKQVLEKITGTTINSSRQHYIKSIVPHTYRQLLQQGITNDHSMGYATHLGFRAGTCAPFPWYDLENEAVTTLQLHPFCFMDTAALYEEKLDAPTAFRALHLMASILRTQHSQLVTIFHNFSLGAAPEWHGWKEAYDGFVKEFAR